MSEKKVYNFTVNISLDNNNAIFTYFEDGKEVSGGGKVQERNSLGIYTLNEETLAKGFKFIGAVFTNREGNCEGDFNYVINDEGKSISISDTDENNGIICMIFQVKLNDKIYESEDPQVENEKEL
jgi:hypothetical protein